MSSIIKSVKKVNADTIEVGLITERTYRYSGIAEVDELITDFMNADSQGRFYNQHIKGQYLCIKVEDEQAPEKEQTDEEITTELNIKGIISDLEQGQTVVSFGSRKELEELLKVLSVATTISFKAERILANFDYMVATHNIYDGLVLVDGIFQLVATHLVSGNVRIRPINAYHTHTLTSIRYTRTEGLIITPLNNKTEQFESEYDDNEDDKEEEKAVTTTLAKQTEKRPKEETQKESELTLADLLRLKDECQNIMTYLHEEFGLEYEKNCSLGTILEYIHALESKIML